jgi:hypothetical protein
VPLFEADGLHEYKQRFGYELVPHQSAIKLHPAAETVFNNSFVRGAIHVARWVGPASQRVETIATVLQGARRSRPVEQSC